MSNSKTEAPEVDADLMAVVEATSPDAPHDAPAAPDDLGEPEPKPDQPKTAEPSQRRGGFLPLVFGGVISAALGAGATIYAVNQGFMSADTTASQAALAAQDQEIAALKTSLASLPNPVDPGLSDRIAALESATPPAIDTTALEQRIAALEQRLTGIESLPADGSGTSPAAMAAITALQQEVAALKTAGASVSADVQAAADQVQARLAEAQAQAEALKADAQASAAAATHSAAINRIQAALDSGAPYASALAALQGADVPAVLTDAAQTGLPTLAALEASFPDAARAALEASLRANMGESWTARVTAFLRTQTGARSLTPRDGTDPDAVLSRAEAALHGGKLADAVAELAALPEVGQAAMKDWVATATRRLQAEGAVAALSAAE